MNWKRFIRRQPRRPTCRPTLELLEDRLTPAISSTTSPPPAPVPPNPPPAAHFAIIGDYGLAGPREQDVANLVKSWSPEFILTLGDNNYGGGGADTIDANIGQYYHDFIYPYTGNYGPGATTNRFFPTLGDEDWNATAGFTPYLDYFALPGNERYYTFTQGPVQFFALDSDPHEPDGNSVTSVQAQWLQNALAASTATWKLVYFQNPPYSSHGGASVAMRWPFQAWGADAVFSGNAHTYERIVQANNFPYFINGLGGGDCCNNPFSAPTTGSQVRYNNAHAAMRVDANQDQITFREISRTGELIDTYTLYAVPSAHVPDAPGGLTAAIVSASEVVLSWTDYAGNEANFKIERSSDGFTFTPIATVGANVISYSDNGLTGTSYLYRVTATNAAGNSAYSNVAVVAPSSGPATPSNLTATAASYTRVDLTWADNSSNETGFRVERSLDGSTWLQIITVAANVTSYSDTGRTANRLHYYRVRATNSAGDSPYSSVASATTSPPAVPSNLTATAASYTQADLTWTDNSGDETGFKVFRSTNGTTWTLVTTVGANVTSYSDTGRTANKLYYYQVKSTNAVGDSASSNTDSVTTSPPAVPGNLTATPAPSGRIDLTWTDNSSDETGFKVFRSTDGGTWTRIATVDVNVTAFSDTGRVAGRRCYYRVKATNAVGDSDFSNEVSVIAI